VKKLTNLLVFAFVVLFTLSSCAEKERTTFEINGTAKGYEDGLGIELRDNNRDLIAKTELKDGQFQFTGSVEEPHFASLTFADRRNFNFILENGVYQITRGNGDGYISGGKLNDIVHGYELEEAYRKMVKEHAEAPDPFKGVDMMDKEALTQARKISGKRRRATFNYQNDYRRNIVEGDYPTLVKMFTLPNLNDWDNYGYDRKIELYTEYEKELGAHPVIVNRRNGLIEAKKTLEIQQSVAPGKPFKDVVGQTKEGEQLKLSEVIAKNKYTLLEMWASWCGPCRGEFPHLKKAYSHYNKKGFEIYALSLDGKEEAWLKAMEEEDVPWLNVVDYKEFEADGPMDYGVKGIPASFLIDQKGTIVASMQQVRGFALDEKLEELLGEVE
jgi:thiol-disulfide isomerase/thioredoxin